MIVIGSGKSTTTREQAVLREDPNSTHFFSDNSDGTIGTPLYQAFDFYESSGIFVVSYPTTAVDDLYVGNVLYRTNNGTSGTQLYKFEITQAPTGNNLETKSNMTTYYVKTNTVYDGVEPEELIVGGVNLDYVYARKGENTPTLVWEKYHNPVTFVYTEVDVNGNLKYVRNTSATSTPYYVENTNYDGTAVSYAIGKTLSQPPDNADRYDWMEYIEYPTGIVNPIYNIEQLVIPSNYKGMPVEIIGDYGISLGYLPDNCAYKKIIVSEGIKKIGMSGIYFRVASSSYQNDKIELTLPKSLENITAVGSSPITGEGGVYLYSTTALNLDVIIYSSKLTLTHGSVSKSGTGVYTTAIYAKTAGLSRFLIMPTVEELPTFPNSNSSIGVNQIIIEDRDSTIKFPYGCLKGLWYKDPNCILICKPSNPNLLDLASSLSYDSKNAAAGTIHTNNQALYDHDWAADNTTITFYKLDGVTQVTQLEKPTISLDGSIVTITAVTNATKYQVLTGSTVLATITGTSIDLSQYLTTANTYTITVRAFANGYVASTKSASVSYTVA